MDKVAGANRDDYQELIQEAFLAPIRTVTVIDDEYPTIDDLLENELPEGPEHQASNWKPEALEQVRDILKFCRAEKRQWLVDVHDGRSPTEADHSGRLQHSDLLILDYQLEGEPGGGTKAIEILRKLAGNDHFNLVVVYTHAARAPQEIAGIVHEITVSLLRPSDSLEMAPKALDALEEAIEKWSSENESIESILRSFHDRGAYLKARTSYNDPVDTAEELDEFQGLLDLIDNKPKDVKIGRGLFLRWALYECQKRDTEFHAGEDYGRVRFAVHSDGINWIRTDRLFVTVVSKKESPDSLPEQLLDALCIWDPTPHRLIMSRMRAELDKRGVPAESKVLSNRYLQAGWLEELLTAGENRLWISRNSVRRHWESLGDMLEPPVIEYADKVAGLLETTEEKEAIQRFFELDAAEHITEIRLHTNLYNCSKPMEGHHLTTGHVLEIKVKGEQQFWLCLSPACDLEPGQKGGAGWQKRLGEWLPFKSVPLKPIQLEDALQEATGGGYLFLDIEGKPKVFDCALGLWEQMFAAKQGKFNGDGFSFSLGRIENGAENLVVQPTTGRIVAQLRYEYAINLLSRLGTKLSRIGLDFQNAPATRERNG